MDYEKLLGYLHGGRAVYGKDGFGRTGIVGMKHNCDPDLANMLDVFIQHVRLLEERIEKLEKQLATCVDK